MIVLDRKIAPPLADIELKPITSPEVLQMNNGSNAYVLRNPNLDLLRIDLIIKTGKWQEHKRITAHATAKMLDEGTASQDARQIAERLDFYGASFKSSANPDYTTITVYTLGEHFGEILPLIEELVQTPVFPEKELKTFIQRGVQKLQINQMKNDFVAGGKFYELIFGDQHPYGYIPTEIDFKNLQSPDLLKYHASNYNSVDRFLVIAGNVNDKHLKLLDKHLGSTKLLSLNGNGQQKQYSAKEHALLHRMSDSVQSAIRVGRKLFNKTHPDHTAMFLLNTILGGFYGSRLMSNLRQDKGYTYGIGSRINSMLHSGVFSISTEVNKEFRKGAMKEIYSEIARLQSEQVGTEELTLVKQYLLGTALANIDGVYNISKTIQSLILFDLDIDYFYKTIQDLQKVSAKEITQLAQKYLDKDSLFEVIAE